MKTDNENQPDNKEEVEAECNECGWKGNRVDMIEDDLDTTPFYSCPECLSENIYYHN